MAGNSGDDHAPPELQSQIPAVMITMEMAAHSPLGKLMHEKGLIPKLKQSKTTYLATYLLQERNNKDSLYAEYFDTLPKSFGEFPVFFSEDEKAWLKGSPF